MDRDIGYESAETRSDLVGQEGRAITDLRPSGTALFGDERSAAYRRLYSKIVAMAPAPYGFGAKAPR